MTTVHATTSVPLNSSCPLIGSMKSVRIERGYRTMDDGGPESIGGMFETKDSGEREQYASGMVRDTTDGKTKWHLIASGPMLVRWAELMTRGAEKYDDDNWMKADSLDEYTRFRQSAYRHFMQWYMGHDDEDHAAAVIFNMNGAEYVKGMLT